jgi:hypothetical protein
MEGACRAPRRRMGTSYVLSLLLLLLLPPPTAVVDAFDVCAVAMAAPGNTIDMTAVRVFNAADEVCALPACTLYKRTLAAVSEAGLGTSQTQLTHGLKPPGRNP